jgi:hypothetical protein
LEIKKIKGNQKINILKFKIASTNETKKDFTKKKIKKILEIIRSILKK